MELNNLQEAAVLFTLRNEDYKWDTDAKLENLDDNAGWTFIGLTQKYDGDYLKEKYDTNIM